MYQEQFFPTFKGWWRTMTAPKVRHSMRKRSSGAIKSPVAVEVLRPGNAFTIQGALKPGLDSRYAINGKDFVIDPETTMPSTLNYGTHCIVEGVIAAGGERLAAKITIK